MIHQELACEMGRNVAEGMRANHAPALYYPLLRLLSWELLGIRGSNPKTPAWALPVEKAQERTRVALSETRFFPVLGAYNLVYAAVAKDAAAVAHVAKAILRANAHMATSYIRGNSYFVYAHSRAFGYPNIEKELENHPDRRLLNRAADEPFTVADTAALKLIQRHPERFIRAIADFGRGCIAVLLTQKSETTSIR